MDKLLIGLMCDMCELWGKEEKDFHEQITKAFVLASYMGFGEEWETLTDSVVQPLTDFLKSDSEDFRKLLRHQLRDIGKRARNLKGFETIAIACYALLGLSAVKYKGNETAKAYAKALVNLLEWFEQQYEIETAPVDIDNLFDPPDEE